MKSAYRRLRKNQIKEQRRLISSSNGVTGMSDDDKQSYMVIQTIKYVTIGFLIIASIYFTIIINQHEVIILQQAKVLLEEHRENKNSPDGVQYIPNGETPQESLVETLWDLADVIIELHKINSDWNWLIK